MHHVHGKLTGDDEFERIKFNNNKVGGRNGKKRREGRRGKDRKGRNGKRRRIEASWAGMGEGRGEEEEGG